MEKGKTRSDDFALRRNHIRDLSDQELKDYFWRLAEQAVNPLIELAKTHTTPSIERSVLLRMGFSSLEAKAIVEHTIDHHLMGKGAGHCVYRLSQLKSVPIREAGLLLMQGSGWDEVVNSFGGGK